MSEQRLVRGTARRTRWTALILTAAAAAASTVLVGAAPASAWTPTATWSGVVDGANGIDVDPTTGDVWVSSGFDGTLRKLDGDGNPLLTAAGSGTAPGQLNGPGDVIVGADGDVYVQDRGNDRINRYRPDGTFAQSFGGPSLFNNPLGLAVDAGGDLYAADAGNGTVRRFSPQGDALQSYSGLGPVPFGIAVDPDGKLWVTTQGGTVRKVDPVTGAIELEFSIPNAQLTDIEFDAAGNANVMEFNSSRVLVYTRDGVLVDELSIAPSNGFRLAIHPDGRLLVTALFDILVFDPPADPDDEDGVDAAVEDAAPNGGDGNADGVADSSQANVASLPAATGAGYVTLAAPDGTALAAVTATELPADPAPPANVTFPIGLLGFEVRGLTPGATVDVDVHVPGGVAPDSFWKLLSGAYVALDSAVIDGDVVTLTLTDGGPFDADGVADGVIVDPVGLGDEAELDHIALSPATAIAGVGATQAFTVAGFDADGNGLGDLTASATLTVEPDGSCASAGCSGSAVGPHTVTATVDGFTSTASLDVRLAQTISFGALATKTLLQTPVTVAGTASSGLAVSFSTATPEVCTSGGTRGRTITLVAEGDCTVVASQPGNATFAAAPPLSRTFTVNKAAQTISFPAFTATSITASPVTAAATASSGLPVTFTSSTPAVCSTDGPGGSTVNLLSGGTCTIRTDQPGNATFAAAPSVSRSFNVTKLAQTITFTGPTAKTLAQTPVVVAASASSGLAVTFTTTTPAVCTAGGVDGATIDLVGAGTCTVRAVQPGDGTYGAAAVSRSFTVSKVAQTIVFPAPAPAAPLQPFTVAATASSGLAVAYTTTTPAVCSVDGTEVMTVTTGTCTIRAEQAGDAYWKAAPAAIRNVNVAKVAQTITFDPITSPKSTATDQAFSIAATASSGLGVTFNTTTPAVCTVTNFFGGGGGSVRLVRDGTCTLRAAQVGDATFKAAPVVTRSFTVTQPSPAVDNVYTSTGATLLPPGGGSLDVYAGVSDATTCRYTVAPTVAGFPLIVPCPNGSAMATVALPANTGAAGKNHTVTVTAQRSGAPSASRSIVLRVASANEPVADLSVSGSPSVDPKFGGEAIPYTLTVTNAGPDAATGVDLRADLQGPNFVSAEAGAGSCTVEQDRFLACSLGTVASGGAVDVVVTSRGSGMNVDVTTTTNDFDVSGNVAQVYVLEVEPRLVYADDRTSQIYAMPSAENWSDPFGSPTALTSQPGQKANPVLSPDKRTVAYSRQDTATGNWEIWAVGIDGTGERRLVELNQGNYRGVAWAPDGQSVVATVLVGATYKAMVASTVGEPNPHLLIADTTYGETTATFTPDGTTVIFQDSCQRPEPARCRYHRVAADGSGTPVAYSDYPTGRGVVIDPDGEWFYYATGSSTIQRARLDGTLSEPVVTDLMWDYTYWSLSPQGDKIAYTTTVGSQVVVATVNTDGSGFRQLTTPIPGAAPAGCYAPTWNRQQTEVFMHCYPFNFAITIAKVAADVSEPTAPENLGGSSNSRMPDLAGWRPPY